MGRDVTKERRRSEAIVDTIAAMIRESSESHRLIAEHELHNRFMEQCDPSSGDLDPDLSSLLASTLDQHEDLHRLPGDDGARWYYSSLFMTQPYAVLLLQKQYNLARLIAEVVRQNSAAYPRPVPVDTFRHPPFLMTDDQIAHCLKGIDGDEEFKDIASVTTSAASRFLYSTLYLEPDHASMLAEWFDVGVFDNP